MVDGVSVRIYPPSDALRGYVTFFYFVEVTTAIIDFLYPEWANVRFALSGEWRVELLGAPSFVSDNAALFGPTDRRGLISTLGGQVVGFGLTPLGWHAVVRADAARMANRTAPLTDQIGGSGPAIREQLMGDDDDHVSVERLERILQDRIAAHPPVEARVAKIDAAFRKAPANVQEFAAEADVSPRTLQRTCLATFGFAPKRLLRLQRFLETLGRVRSAVGEPLNEGLGPTYYDQPQFYRDFRDFMQMTPSAYLAAARRVMATAAAAQRQAKVTLSFDLPPAPDCVEATAGHDAPAPAEPAES